MEEKTKKEKKEPTFKQIVSQMKTYYSKSFTSHLECNPTSILSILFSPIGCRGRLSISITDCERTVKLYCYNSDMKELNDTFYRVRLFRDEFAKLAAHLESECTRLNIHIPKEETNQTIEL
jgi:hypothetical protein